MKYWHENYKWFFLALFCTTVYSIIYIAVVFFLKNSSGAFVRVLNGVIGFPIIIGGIILGMFILPWDFKILKFFWIKFFLQVIVFVLYLWYFVSHGKFKGMTYTENFISLIFLITATLISNQTFKNGIIWYFEFFTLFLVRIFVGIQFIVIFTNLVRDILKWLSLSLSTV